MRHLLPPVLALVFLLLMFALNAWLPLARLIERPLSFLGFALDAAGIAIAVAGRLAFRRADTEINTFREPGQLVTAGVFRFSRNPMYLGMALLLFGTAIALGSLSPLLVAALFVVIADRWYIRVEEANMQAKFGDAYTAYRKRVRRWL